MSIHQWNGRSSPPGAVLTTTLYGTSPSTARSRASTSRTAIATARDLAVGRAVEPLTPERQRARGRRTTPSTPADTRSTIVVVDDHAAGRRALRRSRRARGRAARVRSGRACASTNGGTKSSATTCACGCSIDAPAGLAVVDERVRVDVTVGELVRDAVAQHAEHLDRRVVVEVGERAVVCGRQHDDLVRAGARPSPTIGYLFGTTRTRQPGVSGSPGPRRARPRAASRARCRRRTGRPATDGGQRRRRVAERVRARTERPGATITRRRRSTRSSRSSEQLAVERRSGSRTAAGRRSLDAWPCDS